MLINCWELGLESVPEEAVLLMASAVEVTALLVCSTLCVIVISLQFLLKNILTAVIQRRKTYKTVDKGFKHAFGHGATVSKFVSVSTASSGTETNR